MRKEQHDRLLQDIDALRDLLARCSLESIVGACHAYWLTRGADRKGLLELLSPGKQWPYLLGLMLTTSEPEEGIAFGEQEARTAAELLNAIFSTYAWAYFPETHEEMTEEWARAREVAMPAFLNYFNQGILASVQQIEGRVTRYLVPFDGQLVAEMGLSATHALEIARWISERLQESANSLVVLAAQERQARHALLDRMQREGWDLERLRQEASGSDYARLAKRLFGGIGGLSQVSRSAIAERFLEAMAAAFWGLFSVGRGDLGDLTYPTDFNAAEERSLYRIDAERAICPLGNQLFLAVLSRLERHLLMGRQERASSGSETRSLRRKLRHCSARFSERQLGSMRQRLKRRIGSSSTIW